MDEKQLTVEDMRYLATLRPEERREYLRQNYDLSPHVVEDLIDSTPMGWASGMDDPNNDEYRNRELMNRLHTVLRDAGFMQDPSGEGEYDKGFYKSAVATPNDRGFFKGSDAPVNDPDFFVGNPPPTTPPRPTPDYRAAQRWGDALSRKWGARGATKPSSKPTGMLPSLREVDTEMMPGTPPSGASKDSDFFGEATDMPRALNKGLEAGIDSQRWAEDSMGDKPMRPRKQKRMERRADRYARKSRYYDRKRDLL
jgi:hypothetical protein